MSKIVMIKVNKGGIGKTTISCWLAHGITTLLNKKVLLLTSDSQNNILDYCFKDGKVPKFKSGLKKWVLKGNGDIVKIRKNLDFIPLESNVFGPQFLKKFSTFIGDKKKEYDYIIVDSIPTMGLDNSFLKLADKIVIPAFCDRVTTQGVINVIDEVGITKIACVIPNKFENTTNQKKYLDLLKDNFNVLNIKTTKPIKNMTYLAKLNEKGKTIWESKSQNKDILEIQEEFMLLISDLNE